MSQGQDLALSQGQDLALSQGQDLAHHLMVVRMDFRVGVHLHTVVYAGFVPSQVQAGA